MHLFRNDACWNPLISKMLHDQPYTSGHLALRSINWSEVSGRKFLATMPSNGWSWTSVCHAGQSAVTTWTAGLIQGRCWLFAGGGEYRDSQPNSSPKKSVLDGVTFRVKICLTRRRLFPDLPSVVTEGKINNFHQLLHWNHHCSPSHLENLFFSRPVTFSSAVSHVTLMITVTQLWSHVNWSVLPRKGYLALKTSSRYDLARAGGTGTPASLATYTPQLQPRPILAWALGTPTPLSSTHHPHHSLGLQCSRSCGEAGLFSQERIPFLLLAEIRDLPILFYYCISSH